MFVYCYICNGTHQQEARSRKVTYSSLTTFPGKTIHYREINTKQCSITMTICTVKTSFDLANN